MIINSAALAGLLTDLSRCASANRDLPSCNAVLLRPGWMGDQAVIIGEATDRYIVAESWIAVAEDALPDTVLISLREIKDIMRILRGAPRPVDVELSYSDHDTVLRIDGYLTWSLPTRSFPATRCLWAADDSPSARVERARYPRNAFAIPGTRLGALAAISKRRNAPLVIRTGRTVDQPINIRIGAKFRALAMTTPLADTASYEVPAAAPQTALPVVAT